MQQNNFFDAFNEAIKLNEGVAEIAQKVAGVAKNAADTAVAKKQVKTQQANDQAKATSESLKPIMDLLQPIANAQSQFDDNNIKQISDLINKLPNLDNVVKKQINQMLNQQKAALQQKEQPANNQQNNAEKPVENQQDDATKDETSTTGKPAQPEQKGDASKITKDGDKNVVNTYIDTIVQKLQSSINGISRDDVIAFIKTL